MIIIDENYMSQSKQDRQSHLDLKEPCVERILQTQYKNSGYSYYLKGLLAHFLDTNIPLRNKDGINVLMAHACNNAKCCNPKHLYWATHKENIEDSGTFNERTIKKYGKDFYKIQNKKLAKQKSSGFFSKINNRKGKSLSEEHKKNLSKAIKKWHENRI